MKGKFVWSRMGTEAGECLGAIIRRKEVERQANGGKFVWGIGHSVRKSIVCLMEDGGQPKAVFTPMQSKPRDDDKEPSCRVWLDELLPQYSFVTSHARRKKHYALLCKCDKPLPMQSHGVLNKGGLVNYPSGKPKIGQGSTFVVEMKDNGEKIGDDYCIRFVASLYGEGCVELTKYKDISKKAIAEVKCAAAAGDVEKWKALIGKLKSV